MGEQLNHTTVTEGSLKSSAITRSSSGLLKQPPVCQHAPLSNNGDRDRRPSLRDNADVSSINDGFTRTNSSTDLSGATQSEAKAVGFARVQIAYDKVQQENKSGSTNNKSIFVNKSNSLASLNTPNAAAKASLFAKKNHLPYVRISNTNDVNQENNGDEQLRVLKLVCDSLKSNDSDRILTATVVIQRAFRKYQIGKRFRMITEQLRQHTCQSSSSTSSRQLPTTTSDNNNDNSKHLSSNGNHSNQTTNATAKARAAAWESLTLAASRFAALSQANKSPSTTSASPVSSKSNESMKKSASSLQVNQIAIGTNINHNNRTNDEAQLGNTRSMRSLDDRKQVSNIIGQSVDSNQMKPSDSSSVVAAALSFQQLESLRKRQYRVGLNIFNKHPEKGISYLIAHSFIDCSLPYNQSTTSYYLANQLHYIDNKEQQNFIDVKQNSKQQLLNQPVTCRLCIEEENLKKNIAHFLLHRKGLAKEKIGQYLGNLQAPFNQDVLRYYLQELDFSGMQIDMALRKFLSTVRMPGEAQKIERFVDYFSERFIECQQQQQHVPNATSKDSTNSIQSSQSMTKVDSIKQKITFPTNNKQQLTSLSKDEIFILTFAIIMLNTDLHSPSLKSTSRMSSHQFIHNLRGVFKSQTISENDLLEIYERVKSNQITTTPDHVSHVLKVQQSLTPSNFHRKDTIPNLCSPHRRLVCFCRLYEVYDISKKERIGSHQREIFLFNDMLLVTKLSRRARNTSSQQYCYRQSIPLQGLRVKSFQSSHYNFGIRLSQRRNNDTVIIFNARNELDQSRFFHDLSESIAEMEEMETIRVHNIIDVIHSKHLEYLKRHTMIHEVQSSGLYEKQQTQGKTSISGKLCSGILPEPSAQELFPTGVRTCSLVRVMREALKKKESSKIWLARRAEKLKLPPLGVGLSLSPFGTNLTQCQTFRASQRDVMMTMNRAGQLTGAKS